MQDLPPAADLLGAIAALLGDRVLDEIDDPALAHEVRVAASLCRILAREADLDETIDPAQHRALASVVDGPGTTAELEARLAAELLDGRPLDAEVLDALRALVGGKVDVARPGYRA
ncbi:MAG: DUF6285 domain-containing protein [Acidimicrobiia bacterium]